jgi:hypothetical protein
MNKVTRFVKKSFIALSLASLSVVLFPEYSQPLWEWAASIGGAFGQDVLPSFDSAQGLANLALLVLVLGGIVYNLWLGRRHEVLKAEYAHKTGATHLKQKVHELQVQVYQLTLEREQLQESYNKLNQAHTTALVVAKEYEVRSKFGQEDRDSLRELRSKIETLLRDSGHTQGFREAMAMLLTSTSPSTEFPGMTPSVTSPTIKGVKNGRGDRTALPFEH